MTDETVLAGPYRSEVDRLHAEIRRLKAIADDVTADNLLAEAQDEITDLQAQRQTVLDLCDREQQAAEDYAVANPSGSHMDAYLFVADVRSALGVPATPEDTTDE